MVRNIGEISQDTIFQASFCPSHGWRLFGGALFGSPGRPVGRVSEAFHAVVPTVKGIRMGVDRHTRKPKVLQICKSQCCAGQQLNGNLWSEFQVASEMQSG